MSELDESCAIAVAHVLVMVFLFVGLVFNSIATIVLFIDRSDPVRNWLFYGALFGAAVFYVVVAVLMFVPPPPY